MSVFKGLQRKKLQLDILNLRIKERKKDGKKFLSFSVLFTDGEVPLLYLAGLTLGFGMIRFTGQGSRSAVPLGSINPKMARMIYDQMYALMRNNPDFNYPELRLNPDVNEALRFIALWPDNVERIRDAQVQYEGVTSLTSEAGSSISEDSNEPPFDLA